MSTKTGASSGNAAARVAVIRFPGMNCEQETKRAAEAAGLACDVFNWNGPRTELEAYDGYLLPGGFSYEDRVRAGAIAAKDRVVECLFEQGQAGKPIIGMCNGAQILLEGGLVPGVKPGNVEMALATNEMPDRDGYYSRWVNCRVESGATCATGLAASGDFLPVPVAHAEGRFVTATDGLIDRLFENGQVVFTYATPDGDTASDFPDNPNGSTRAIAAISNPAGNVVAMMPHPERATWLFQVPADLPGEWGDRRREARGTDAFDAPGPGGVVMRSMALYLRERQG